MSVITINISDTAGVTDSAVSANAVGSGPPPPAEGVEVSDVRDEEAPAPPTVASIEGVSEAETSGDSGVPSPPEVGRNGTAGDVYGEFDAPAPPDTGSADETAEAMAGEAPPPPMDSESGGTAMASVEDDEGGPGPLPVAEESDAVTEFSLEDLDKDPPPVEDESHFAADDLGGKLSPPLQEEGREQVPYADDAASST